jgi:hypothetical protein
MTDEQILNMFQHPGINASWFARRLFEGRPGRVESVFHNKLNHNRGETFSPEEMAKLREVVREFANYPI